MTKTNSSFYGGQKNGGSSQIGGQASNSGGPPFFFEIFFFFFQVLQVNPTFLPVTSTLLPKHKFEIVITNSRNDFYTLLQNLNKNGQKRTRKKILDTKVGPYRKRPSPTILKWIKNTHSDNFTINTEPLTLKKD